MPTMDDYIQMHEDKRWIVDLRHCKGKAVLGHGLGHLWNAHVPSAGFIAGVRIEVKDRMPKFMLDSGASYHVVNEASIVDLANREIKLDKPMRVETANGTIHLGTQVDTHIPILGTSVRAYVAPKCTDILALGKICYDLEIDFRTRGKRKPTLHDVDGNKLKVWVEHNVPFVDTSLPDGGTVNAAVGNAWDDGDAASGPPLPPPSEPPGDARGGGWRTRWVLWGTRWAP